MVKRGLMLVIALLVLAGALLWAFARPTAPSLAQPVVPDDAPAATRGAAAFLGAGFGGISQDALESNAIPWKLAAAALVLEERAQNPDAPMTLATVRDVMRRFGFLYPRHLSGVPTGGDVALGSKPLGMTHGMIAPVGGAKVEVANLGCAACHAGVAYDDHGMPLPDRAVPGMPNTSLDLESYTQAVFTAMRRHAAGDALLDAADTLFPDMDWRERASLRYLVMPLARQRLAALEGQSRPMPFRNGVPGATNGVAALKLQLGTPLIGGGPGDSGFVSIPELALRDRRGRLLADGAYAVPQGAADRRAALAAITSFFTVPSMGVHPDQAQASIGAAQDIFAWLADYRPQGFPGPVDRALARRGHAVYGASCASCHGSFAWGDGAPQLAEYRDWTGNVGTDDLRAKAFDAALASAVGGTAYADRITVKVGDGYAATPLAGLWASAPYLHNGSVQSLAALLDPALRMGRFQAGGHALDFASVGIRLAPDGRYPADYRPFSTPQWIDTRQPGLGNAGHLYGQELSAQDRRALLEFLKLL